MNIKLLVILITFNSEKVIEKCLVSISRQALSDFKLLVIDNNSTDGTLKTVSHYFLNHQRLKNKTELLKKNQNIGFARAVNIGLKKALSEEYKAVLLINPDTYFDNKLFKNGIEELFSKKDIGACCPKILYPDGKVWWMGTRPLSIKEIVFGLDYGISKNTNQGKVISTKNEIFESDLLTGCIFFIKTKAIKKVGLFNENYFMYVEDFDYSLRLRKLNYRLSIFTNSVIYHSKDTINKISMRELRREKIAITSYGKYILQNYSLYIFIIWLIKLPLILGFKFIWKFLCR